MPIEMIRPLAMVLCAAVLTGCVPKQLLSQFSAEEVEWFHQEGNNSIEGSALVRTAGGEVRTCAGLSATLYPASEYSRERIGHFYGNLKRGYRQAQSPRIVFYPPAPPAYYRYTRSEICDAQGEFVFSGLPDGEYYLTTTVTWSVVVSIYQQQVQGGFLMQRVLLAGGETKRVVMAR